MAKVCVPDLPRTPLSSRRCCHSGGGRQALSVRYNHYAFQYWLCSYTLHRWRILLSLPEFVPSLSRLLVSQVLYLFTAPHLINRRVFDIQTHLWDRIETKLRPQGRSGHRMIIWKHYIVLFGGFIDPGVRSE